MRTEEIEDEIARTRGEMASTLNAIERKLSPRQIMDQAVDTMREIASDRSRVASVVRENPIPLALIGLGIGWFAVSSALSGRREEPEVGSYESMEGVGQAPWATSPTPSGYGYASGVETPAYGAGGNGGVAETASEVGEQARERLSQASGRVRQWSQSARKSANQAADRTWEAYQEHPLTMAAVALFAGAALGLVIPRSRTETEALQGPAGSVLQRAREAGSELADKAAQVADRAVQAAKEEVRGEGVRGENLSGPSSTMTH